MNLICARLATQGARRPASLLAVVLVLLATTFQTSWAKAQSFLAGAARVEITPPADRIPEGYFSILDPIYTRAIYVENGSGAALLMNGDLIGIPEPFWQRVSVEIAQATGVPVDNIILSATHDHSSPFLAAVPGGADSTPKRDAYTAAVEKAMIAAATQAKAARQPAKIGFATGHLDLNVNRDAINLDTRLWTQEPNPLYPSDKTLAVVQFVKMNGDPIAIYMNYAMHAVSLFLRGDVTGDFPGEAERYVENVYDGKMVAIWSSAAAGDQNPMYLRAIHPITRVKIQNEMDPSKAGEAGKAEENGAIDRLMHGKAKYKDLPPDPKLAAQSTAIMRSMGDIIAEEALRVMADQRRFVTAGSIQGSSAVLNCPGRKRLDNAREGVPGRYEDADPVTLHIGQLRIGDIAFGRANAELYTMIGMHVKEQSPFTHTLMVTLADGSANTGYVPTDDAFGRYTFQVLSSRLRPGCAEKGISNGIVDLMEKDLSSSQNK